MSEYRQLYNILKILWQVIAWSMLFTLPILANTFLKPGRLIVIKHKINYWWLLLYYAATSIWVGLFYINTLWAIPRFATAKNMFRYFFMQLVFVFLQLLTLALLLATCAKNYGNKGVLSCPPAIAYACMGVMLVAIVYQLVKAGNCIAGHAFETIVYNHCLRAELTTQQNSVKPYFFNAGLMNMVTLAKKRKDQAGYSLHKFNKVNRYILYEPTDTRIALEKEIERLKDYVELQQQLFKNKVSIVVSPDIKEGLYEVKPMVMIPFIEKAFNYKKVIPGNSRVEITLNEKKNMLSIIVTSAEASSLPQQIVQKLTQHKNDASIRRKLLINCHAKLT